jgi:small subunit ribosomal protein S1
VTDPPERLAEIRRARSEAAERWAAVRTQLQVGALVSGTVERLVPFGVFVDLGVGFPGLIRRTDLDPAGGLVQDDEFPELGSTVEGIIVGLEEDAQQVILSRRLSEFARFAR